MLVYEAGGFTSGYACAGEAAPPTAADFASADIVLTTYETLQRDLHRHGLEAVEHRLRRPKKYQVTLSLRMWLFCRPCNPVVKLRQPEKHQARSRRRSLRTWLSRRPAAPLAKRGSCMDSMHALVGPQESESWFCEQIEQRQRRLGWGCQACCHCLPASLLDIRATPWPSV